MEQYWPPLAAGCHWKSVGLDCCEINTLPCENQPFCKTFGSLHSRLVPVPSAQQKKGPEQPLVTCELCCEPALSSADESLSCWVFILAADCLHRVQGPRDGGVGILAPGHRAGKHTLPLQGNLQLSVPAPVYSVWHFVFPQEINCCLICDSDHCEMCLQPC